MQTPWISLVKHNPTPKTLRLEWDTTTNDGWVFWQERKVRLDGTRRPATGHQQGTASEKAARALQQKWIAEKLADGYVRKDERREKPRESKPWPKGRAHPPRWLAQVDKREHDRVRKLIKNAKLEHRAADIESLVRPAVRFALKPAKTARGVTSRFGGDPDLPAGFAWPMQGKTPLAFVGQFRLDELARYDLENRLPSKGVLSVFAYLVPDGDDYGHRASVHYFPDVKKLTRTAPTHAASADDRPAKMALAPAYLALTVPSPDEAGGMHALRLTDDERERYHDKLWLKLRRSSATLGGSHQLLGGPKDFLLQIDSDARFGLELGDVEAMTFFLAPKRLAARDFRAVRASLFAE